MVKNNKAIKTCVVERELIKEKKNNKKNSLLIDTIAKYLNISYILFNTSYYKF